jgi:DNA-directed RNA polymerase sigma subunit (sigma70/sigma32)
MSITFAECLSQKKNIIKQKTTYKKKEKRTYIEEIFHENFIPKSEFHETILQAEIIDKLRTFSTYLSPLFSQRDALVFCLKNGWCGNEKITLSYIGSVVGLSKERCRQIVYRSYRRLRHPSFVIKIKSLLIKKEE